MTTGFRFQQSTSAYAMNWNPGRIGAAFAVFAVFCASDTWLNSRIAGWCGPML